jgi:hypothetical protein
VKNETAGMALLSLVERGRDWLEIAPGEFSAFAFAPTLRRLDVH